MNNKRKLLFATDFSPTAKVALQNLVNYVDLKHVDVYLMHVFTENWKNWFTSGLTEKEAYQRLTFWQEVIQQQFDPDKIFIGRGNAAEAIISKANELDVDYLILGGEKESSKSGFLTGTTAQQIVKQCPRITLLAKKPTVKKIICAIDCSEPAKSALREARWVAKRFNAFLAITYVMAMPEFNPLGISYEEIQKIEAEEKQKHTDEVNAWIKEFNLKDVNYKLYLPWGKPGRVILNMAYDFDYDLIVVGRTGKNKFQQTLFGSTAEKILQYAPCSLLVADI